MMNPMQYPNQNVVLRENTNGKLEWIKSDEIINPYTSKNVRVKTLSTQESFLVKEFPNFHKSGSISGMKKLYYGKGALLVRCGNYIYDVTSDPYIYKELAY